MSINDKILKACQDLWHEAVLPSFYANIHNSKKARIARLYVCLMIDAKAWAANGQSIKMLREKYRELTNYIREVMKDERNRREKHDQRAAD